MDARLGGEGMIQISNKSAPLRPGFKGGDGSFLCCVYMEDLTCGVTASEKAAKRPRVGSPAGFHTPQHFSTEDDFWSCTESPAVEDTMISQPGLQGLCLTSSISFQSPRNATGCDHLPPSTSSPFIYCETDTFGGDQTTRAVDANISSFPLTTSPPPPYKRSSTRQRRLILTDQRTASSPTNSTVGDENVDVVEAEAREAPSQEVSKDEDDGDFRLPWCAAKVRFNDDVKVFEYDKPVYDDLLNDEELMTLKAGALDDGFQPNNAGLENWNTDAAYASETLDDMDDCICAPAHIAFIPLIPNRRLVGGGSEDIEKKLYDRLKRKPDSSYNVNTESSSADSTCHTSDDRPPSPAAAPVAKSTLDVSVGVTPRHTPSPRLLTESIESEPPSLEVFTAVLNMGSPAVTPPAKQASGEYRGEDSSQSSNEDPLVPSLQVLLPVASPGLISSLSSPSAAPTLSLLSPVSKLTVQSPTGVDKLYAESLRPTEDSMEPQTPSARSRKSSINSNLPTEDDDDDGDIGGYVDDLDCDTLGNSVQSLTNQSQLIRGRPKRSSSCYASISDGLFSAPLCRGDSTTRAAAYRNRLDLTHSAPGLNSRFHSLLLAPSCHVSATERSDSPPPPQALDLLPSKEVAEGEELLAANGGRPI
eukprot:Blabericola_migrator_1__7210@NODE_365_length_9399_cov_81_035255_g292_i0_p1_GENE_NODE_365_length_9399_cov_81_035255_g292_i0NODE_365_length_9399_cov_81_035255_g292_i0_p1_ORF_typecomplete_len645_score81_81_NODE_365_length_9399_cov_81_035255_g292_i046156549